MLNIEEIKKIIPHRYPFLLIDKVVEMEIGKSCHAVKCITNTEPWFQGHFPEHNVMPGVLLVEAMAQTGAVSILSVEENKGKIAFFSGIKDAKFRREILPGDKLDIFIEIVKLRKNFGIGRGKIYSEGELCVEAEISFFIEK
ncbi:3-hydroxyacyl-ACP dehydratase FabZ [Peptostreptococcus canis]|uniref:3-hydroxyacyl-[acyl-carrier-protein] dehydratase FabZ n=1 Tax=Peptostreptococcus canis TaxID=1159213 RepID=A0ABR6TK66_9FIRM|nr:3-hydroxyacyl-ACP dehydratase FabZ [Peptostreptococcus canis]MBC2575806.1 3-hydroxyacyl-ACP dehydratase FabZ [Peptostreptococcus canis]MBP1998078.1 3-hydroxyacyl-[acyl-carrier-protein] dehydratase [Peptostreptococcus canis]